SPPLRASIVLPAPNHAASFSGSVKKRKIASAGAWISTSRCTMNSCFSAMALSFLVFSLGKFLQAMQLIAPHLVQRSRQRAQRVAVDAIDARAALLAHIHD